MADSSDSEKCRLDEACGGNAGSDTDHTSLDDGTETPPRGKDTKYPTGLSIAYNIPIRHFSRNRELQEKLLEALKEDRYERFITLLQNPEVNPNFIYTRPEYSDFGTCLEIASRLPNRGTFVKALLDAGITPNMHEIPVLPEPIHYAAKEGNPIALEALLQDKRTNINSVDNFGRTALHHAVRYLRKRNDENYSKCITLLLNRHDLDINKANKKGYTAIHEAAKHSGEAVKLILKLRSHDLDLDTHRGEGRTAREYICYRYPELRYLLPSTKQHTRPSVIYLKLLVSLQCRQLEEFTTILQQVDNDGNARIDPNFFYESPHNATCLEIASRDDDCADYVKLLLNAGADPNTVNPITKQTPLHTACKLGNHKVLSVLLNDRRINVNALNDEHKSVLHILAECDENPDQKQQTGTCLTHVLQKHKLNSDEIAIQVNLTDSRGQMAAEIALDRDNVEFLEIMLNYAGELMDLDSVLESRNETLFQAILNKFPHLEQRIPIRRDSFQEDSTKYLFKILYNRSTEEFVHIVETGVPNEELDIDDGNYTLLQYVTLQGLKEPLKALLRSEINPNKTTDFEKRPPIIIASQMKTHELLRVFIEMVPAEKLDINATDAKGNTALHYAAKNEDLDCVVDLMRLGANYHHKNVFDKPPLPANSVLCFLNKSLTTNNKYPEDEDYELIFDYSFLLANKKLHVPQQGNTFSPEMDFLFYISRSKEHRKVMEHPIITNFIHMKWYKQRIYYYINVILYEIFVILLNIHMVLDFGKDSSQRTDFKFHNLIQIMLWMFLSVFTIEKFFQFRLLQKGDFLNLENYFDISLLLLTACLLIFNFMEPTLSVIVILLSWTNMMLVSGRLPALSKNIEIFKTVCANYCVFLLSYLHLISAFTFSFYYLLHRIAENQEITIPLNSKQENEYGFYLSFELSILKTFIMMMGEFEASNYLPLMTEFRICFWLFFLFVFIASMVLVNLLTGLAVSDIQAIKAKANQLSLISTVKLLYESEKNILGFNTFSKLLLKSSKCIHNFSLRLIERTFFFPKLGSRKMIYIHPNKGPTIILDGCKTDHEMDFAVLRDAMKIISNRTKSKDIFDIQRAFDLIQESNRQTYDHIVAHLYNLEEKVQIYESSTYIV